MNSLGPLADLWISRGGKKSELLLPFPPHPPIPFLSREWNVAEISISRIFPLLPAFIWYKLVAAAEKGIAWTGQFPLLSRFVPHPAP